MRLSPFATVDETTPITRLAATEGVDAVSLLAGGVEAGDVPTYTLSVEASDELVREVLESDPDVLAFDLSSVDAEGVYAYVRFRAPPAVGHVREHLTRDSLVVLLPVAFLADGSIELTVVGSRTDLADALEDPPEGVGVTVLELGPFHGRAGHPSGPLTERQLEVVRVAFELGYYETPRRADHEAVAAALECSTSTVSEHLRKAEARLVAALFE
ncbi:hypothetical protein GCM10025298_34360 [Natronobiforma cellulositropha]